MNHFYSKKNSRARNRSGAQQIFDHADLSICLKENNLKGEKMKQETSLNGGAVKKYKTFVLGVLVTTFTLGSLQVRASDAAGPVTPTPQVAPNEGPSNQDPANPSDDFLVSGLTWLATQLCDDSLLGGYVKGVINSFSPQVARIVNHLFSETVCAKDGNTYENVIKAFATLSDADKQTIISLLTWWKEVGPDAFAANLAYGEIRLIRSKVGTAVVQRLVDGSYKVNYLNKAGLQKELTFAVPSY